MAQANQTQLPFSFENTWGSGRDVRGRAYSAITALRAADYTVWCAGYQLHKVKGPVAKDFVTVTTLQLLDLAKALV